MKQSYKASMIETVSSTVLGFVVAVLANWFVLPWYGYKAGFFDAVEIGFIFTFISLIRTFVVRRLFETLRTSGFLP